MMRKVALTILLAAAVSMCLATPPGGNDDPTFAVALGMETVTGVQPGQVTCDSGRPKVHSTSDPLCPPGTHRISIRGQVESITLTKVTGTAAAMFDEGTSTVVINCNLNANLEGDCWGTFTTTVPDQGKWEGSWTGTFDLTNSVAFYSAAGHGSGSQLKGLKMTYYAATPGIAPAVSTEGVTHTMFIARVDGR
jgi:hypothetical protein